MRQPPVSLNWNADDDPTAVPTYLVAVQKLIKKIENEHRGCLEAAEASKASFNSKAGAASSSTPMAPTTFEAMMRLDSARARAVEANTCSPLPPRRPEPTRELTVTRSSIAVCPTRLSANCAQRITLLALPSSALGIRKYSEKRFVKVLHDDLTRFDVKV